MKITMQGIQDRESWNSIGVRVPAYDVSAVHRATVERPLWLHLGPGNIFRGFIAGIADDLLEDGAIDRGITILNLFNPDTLQKVFLPHDNLVLRVEMKNDGSYDRRIFGSIGETVAVERSAGNPGWERAKAIVANPSLQLISLTVTEKGYIIRDVNGNMLSGVSNDLLNDPLASSPKNTVAILTALLYARFLGGAAPLAIVSMDNFSHNGDTLREAVQSVAAYWVKNGHMDAAFCDYLSSDQVAFPWSVIDNITPGPDPRVSAHLTSLGIEDCEIMRTARGSKLAVFVNNETTKYLLIEDRFPNGRPPLDLAGVYLTDRETIDGFESMKVCTCLNPLHTALAIFGRLLGYETIADEVHDPILYRLIREIGEVEGLPVVADSGIIDPKKFLDEVIDVRLSNRYLPDTPQRIATDTSQKLAIRYGKTIERYQQNPELDVQSLRFIAMSIAGWVRYLMAVDDNGAAMELSPDPMMDKLQPCVAGIELGKPDTFDVKQILPILTNKRIFGVDLIEVGLGDQIVADFTEMISGIGAVRALLTRELG